MDRKRKAPQSSSSSSSSSNSLLQRHKQSSSLSQLLHPSPSPTSEAFKQQQRNYHQQQQQQDNRRQQQQNKPSSSLSNGTRPSSSKTQSSLSSTSLSTEHQLDRAVAAIFDENEQRNDGDTFDCLQLLAQMTQTATATAKSSDVLARDNNAVDYDHNQNSKKRKPGYVTATGGLTNQPNLSSPPPPILLPAATSLTIATNHLGQSPPPPPPPLPPQQEQQQEEFYDMPDFNDDNLFTPIPRPISPFAPELPPAPPHQCPSAKICNSSFFNSPEKTAVLVHALCSSEKEGGMQTVICLNEDTQVPSHFGLPSPLPATHRQRSGGSGVGDVCYVQVVGNRECFVEYSKASRVFEMNLLEYLQLMKFLDTEKEQIEAKLLHQAHAMLQSQHAVLLDKTLSFYGCGSSTYECVLTSASPTNLRVRIAVAVNNQSQQQHQNRSKQPRSLTNDMRIFLERCDGKNPSQPLSSGEHNFFGRSCIELPYKTAVELAQNSSASNHLYQLGKNYKVLSFRQNGLV